MSEDFSDTIKIKCLLWCDRHCCLCGKQCGTNIEIAHIISKNDGGKAIMDNAIPLCFDCHSEIGKYNPDHPKGNKYKNKELKARREQIYEQYTRHLVPPIDFRMTQVSINNVTRVFPDLGFQLIHCGDSLPVLVYVKAQVFLDDKNLGLIKSADYNGKKPWHLNPRFIFEGHFKAPPESISNNKNIRIRIIVSIEDQYKRRHELLPVDWIYNRSKNSWYPEP